MGLVGWIQICNTSRVMNSQEDMLELRDGIKMNSQVKVQDEVNLHNQEKGVVNVSWMEVVQ